MIAPGISDSLGGGAPSATAQPLRRPTATVTAPTAGRGAIVARPVRDAGLATAVLMVAIGVGSGGGTALDPALFGYLGATLVATFTIAWSKPNPASTHTTIRSSASGRESLIASWRFSTKCSRTNPQEK